MGMEPLPEFCLEPVAFCLVAVPVFPARRCRRYACGTPNNKSLAHVGPLNLGGQAQRQGLQDSLYVTVPSPPLSYFLTQGGHAFQAARLTLEDFSSVGNSP